MAFFTELYEYVDFVIDEAAADSIEYVVDNGVTYALNKATKASGGTIPGVRMYKILNGQLKEVAAKELKDYACKPINAVARLPYICQHSLDQVGDRFVTYHLNVPKTYAAILRNPFYNNLLSLPDLASRKNSGAPFSKVKEESLYGLLSKEYHGIIYTERDQPERIKYLKVQDGESADKNVLYGNTQVNNLECEKGFSCSAYGHTGQDAFYLGLKYGNFAIKDFKGNAADGDQLVVLGGGQSVEIRPSLNPSDGSIGLSVAYTGDNQTFNFKYATLKGPRLEDVEGWVKVAQSNIKLEKEQRQKNPITIQ